MIAPPQVTIKLTPEAQAALKALGKIEGSVAKEITRAMDKQNELTVAHIAEFRMRGNNNVPFPPADRVLGVRTRNYRLSLYATDAKATRDGVVSSIGSPLNYAGVHEFGFTGQVNVPEHQRGESTVQAHTRAVSIPARQPVTAGIEDRQDAYGEAMSQAVLKALGGAFA